MKTVLENVKKACGSIISAIPRVLSAAFKKFKSLKKPVKIAVCLLLVCAVAASGFGIKKITDSKKLRQTVPHRPLLLCRETFKTV